MQVGGGNMGKFSSDCFYFLHKVGSKTTSRVRRKEECLEVGGEKEGKNNCGRGGGLGG